MYKIDRRGGRWGGGQKIVLKHPSLGIAHGFANYPKFCQLLSEKACICDAYMVQYGVNVWVLAYDHFIYKDFNFSLFFKT